jgi:hypothetical protein
MDAQPPSRPDDDKSAEAERADEAERDFIRGLIERGEVVPEGEELPPAATHEVVEETKDEPPKVRRRRFSTF